MSWQNLLFSGGLFVSAVVFALLLHLILSLITRIWLRRNVEKGSLIFRSVVHHIKGPLRLGLPLLAVVVVLPFATLPEHLLNLLRHLVSILMIFTIAWIVVRSASVLEDYLFDKYRIDAEDNLKARKIHTQMLYLKRVFAIVVGVIALALILMNFEKVRQLGTTILASAGIVGIVLGFASQRSIALLFAGFQVALTQPVRIDDVVIVENEWGRIEEITLTYVVVRIWDKRRLMVPISYFIEKPFQNWTRVSADLLGTVYLYCDYSVPVRAVREELQRILEQSDDWDGQVSGVQVTDTTEQTMAVRALMSASDASRLWNLRCEVREKLIDYIQREFPESLPRFRAEFPEKPQDSYKVQPPGGDQPLRSPRS
ncbi:MAG: mechanosensitive ion channel domain-containing protein [Spirochaetia bacterium]